MESILLINPPYNREVYTETKTLSVHPPVGLAYLASFVQRYGVKVEIIDANALNYSRGELVNRIVDHPSRIVGITSVTALIHSVCKICDEVRAKSDKVIILGGQHGTFKDKEILESCKSIDYIVRGEGEVTLLRLLHRLKINKSAKGLMGVSYPDNNTVVSNPSRPPIKDINKIPFPAWELLPRSKYKLNGFLDIGFKGEQLAKLISSRGCPNKCTFCASAFFWGKVRFRNVDNIYEEIEYLTQKLHVRQIDFMDDCLTIPVSRFKDLCNRIIDNKLNFKWSCYSRVQNITDELVLLMKKAGCFQVLLGIESGNQEIIDSLKKNITLEQVTNAVKLFKKHGIDCLGFFMVGLPKDTKYTVHETVNFAKKLNLDFPFFSVTTPLPGTELYDSFMSSDLAPSNFEWDQFSTHGKTIYRTENLSSEEIKKLYDYAIKKCYFNPTFITNLLINILKNPYKLTRYWKLLRAFVNI
ncbi:MAG: radical SAM protein [Nitrospirae bacterium]|nr:radical SAM protein [Nitrospirota bacterium]